MGCSQTPEEIYHELRERVATAFEVQINKFLDDEKLHSVTMDMYNHIFQLKMNNKIKDYKVMVSQFNEGAIFTSIAVEPNISKEEEFMSHVMMAMQILVRDHMEQNPGCNPHDLNFKLQLNKKSVTIKMITD